MLESDGIVLRRTAQDPGENGHGALTGTWEEAALLEIAPRYLAVSQISGNRSFFLSEADISAVEALPDSVAPDIVVLGTINSLSNVNYFFRAVHRKLREGGYFTGCAVRSSAVKRTIFRTYPYTIAWMYYIYIFIFKRVLPKLALTRSIYLFFSKGRKRIFPTTEILGRLIYCGFDIVDTRIIGSEFYFIVRKRDDILQISEDSQPGGILFKMRRIGERGVPIYVYKFRTMHPYAEYLQAYIHQKNSLDSNGKVNGDFRIAAWGRFLRRSWIDELPMVINWLQGDLKLVGVRPLSEQYFGLYPPELREVRLRHKPGLIPPFYADLPQGFDAILDSETRYMQAYEKNPWRTDLSYFARAIWNICVRGVRSA